MIKSLLYFKVEGTLVNTFPESIGANSEEIIPSKYDYNQTFYLNFLFELSKIFLEERLVLILHCQYSVSTLLLISFT